MIITKCNEAKERGLSMCHSYITSCSSHPFQASATAQILHRPLQILLLLMMIISIAAHLQIEAFLLLHQQLLLLQQPLPWWIVLDNLDTPIPHLEFSLITADHIQGAVPLLTIITYDEEDRQMLSENS
jgi:hypothetical protein